MRSPSRTDDTRSVSPGVLAPGVGRRPTPGNECRYGVTSEIRVDQFPSGARVIPHVPNGDRAVSVRYLPREHRCAMYSEAIQTLFPAGTAAP
jgi:hypothetical protein